MNRLHEGGSVEVALDQGWVDGICFHLGSIAKGCEIVKGSPVSRLVGAVGEHVEVFVGVVHGVGRRGGIGSRILIGGVGRDGGRECGGLGGLQQRVVDGLGLGIFGLEQTKEVFLIQGVKVVVEHGDRRHGQLGGRVVVVERGGPKPDSTLDATRRLA